MHIVISKEVLSNALDIVDKALPVRSSITDLENILLDYGEDRITLTATNLELEIKVNLLHKTDGRGKILLPKKIVDIVRSLPSSDVELKINLENYHIELLSGISKTNLFGANPDDYPLIEMPEPPEEVLSLSQSSFKNILRQVIFAASNDESRPAFNGVLFNFESDDIILISSDTYRLVIKKGLPQTNSIKGGKFLIPAKSLRELLKIIEEGEIEIYPHNNLVVFRMSDVYFATRVLEEKYPDVSGVVPEGYKTKVMLTAKALEETVSRVSLLSEGVNQAVFLSVKEKEMKVKVSSQIGHMEEILAIEREGEDVEVYVNSRFLMDLLKVVDTENMIIEMHGQNGPLIFKSPELEGYLYLVLPIKMK